MSVQSATPAAGGRLALLAAMAALVAVLLAGCGGGEDVAAVARDRGLVGATCAAPGTPSGVTLNYSNRGWWDELGSHDPTNDNTFTGWEFTKELRSFYQFNLGGFTGQVQSATLRLEPTLWASADASESFSLWQVASSAATVASDGTATPNLAVYEDLGDGLPYGASSVTSSQVGTQIDIPLADAALCDLQAALGGTFSIGLRGDSLARTPSTEEGWLFGCCGGGLNQLILQMVP